jgi:lipopolysaccharide/colanic/teichoic acid biosynthesis glycosyltransferase
VPTAQTSSSSYSRFNPIAALPQVHHGPSRPRGREDLKIGSRIVGEKLFREALQRERKRADRSDQPLLLLLMTMDGHETADSSGIWAAALAAVNAAKRETDVLGWFTSLAVIGVILTEVSAVDTSIARKVEGRVRRELGRRLDRDSVSRFSIRFHVHPRPKAPVADGLNPLDPMLEKVSTAPDDRTSVYGAMKRALDVIGSLSLLTLLSPVLLLIAALAKLKSPGPVLFKQVRVGQKGLPFTMLKFRTMHVNADAAIHQAYVSQFINRGGEDCRSATGVFKITNDPRVTRMGRFLRNTSLDELPQLLNVLQGNMSLVGPRPPLPYEVEQYKPWHCRRVLEAKPGITGLWQVTGRSRTTFDDMVRLDLRYARSRSFLTDVKILMATPAAVIKGKGAC